MDNSDGVGFIVAFFFAGLMFILGIVAGMNGMENHETLIDAGVAYYHPETGELALKDCGKGE